MRLGKIQKFLNENNIKYNYNTDIYNSKEFGNIEINDERTSIKKISEITGRNGISVNGIMIFFIEKTNDKIRNVSAILNSQKEIINRMYLR